MNKIIAVIAAASLGILAVIALYSESGPQPASSGCEAPGQRCHTGELGRIIDGDTIFMDHVGSIRLALVDTPERGETGFIEGKQYWQDHCPVGSEILVIEDVLQAKSYGRIVAVVECGGRIMNEELVLAGVADLEPEFCADAWYLEWSMELGCRDWLQNQDGK